MENLRGLKILGYIFNAQVVQRLPFSEVASSAGQCTRPGEHLKSHKSKAACAAIKTHFLSAAISLLSSPDRRRIFQPLPKTTKTESHAH